MRFGHPLSEGEITPSRYANGSHIAISRRGLDKGPIDEALKAVGQERRIATIVDGFAAALALARASDLIAAVPERHTTTLRSGMVSFNLPVAVPEMTISMLWHPRMDGDAAHHWLRGLILNSGAVIVKEAPLALFFRSNRKFHEEFLRQALHLPGAMP